MRPVIDSFRTEPNQTIYTQPSPVNYLQPTTSYERGGHTAQTPARKEWNYVPSRLASHSSASHSTQSDSRVETGMQPIARTSISRYEEPTQRIDNSIRTTNQGDDLNGWKLVK
jgi:hypothetical protein